MPIHHSCKKPSPQTDTSHMQLQQLQQALTEMELVLSCEQQQQLLQHTQLLQQWNRQINLTTLTTWPQILSHHVLDSLSIAPFISGPNILDIGTGAGFPGIPLAILYPQYHFSLLDPAQNKCAFLRHVVHQLGLKNIQVIADRAQHFSPSTAFANIVTRAWSSLQQLLLESQHLIADNGIYMSMKGTYPTAELAAIAQPYQVHKLSIPLLASERHLVVIPASHHQPRTAA